MFFKKLALLTLFFYTLTSSDSPAMEDWMPDGHTSYEEDAPIGQLQTQALINKDDLLHQYYNLFLDRFETLLLNGNNAEARKFSLAREKAAISEMKSVYDVNTALVHSEYREMQHRQGLTDKEKFSANHFRRYTTDLQTLIAFYEENIKSLEESFQSRIKCIESLEEKAEYSPLQKKILFETLQKTFLELERKHYKIIKDLSEAAEKNPAHADTLSQISTLLTAVFNLVVSVKENPIQDVKKVQDEVFENLNKMSTLHHPWEQNAPEDLKRISHILSLHFFSPPLHFLDKLNDWKQIDEEETLDSLDRRQLEKMLAADEAFTKDTQTKIAEQKARIDFIKAYPEFFTIKHQPRYKSLGISDPEPWQTDFSGIKLGDGVVVGVVDEFDACIQNSRVLAKAINPDFQGRGCQIVINQDENKSHGLHVAGTIVSDLMDKENPDDITIGVAPHAQFQMISFQDLSTPDNPEGGRGTLCRVLVEKQEEIHWTPNKMASAMSELFHKGALTIESNGAPETVKLADYVNNPIVSSPALIMNWSMGGALKRFYRVHPTKFEGLSILPVFLNSMKQGKLWVTTASNDGVDLSTTDQHRFLKALAICPQTSPHIIVATNLMEDGLTLNPSSNIPGNDLNLQKRTLSAPGTNIKSSALKERPDDPDFILKTGTSMAAPHISGVIAIVSSNSPPDLTGPQLSECLLQGATPIIVKEDGTPYALKGTVQELEEAQKAHIERVNILEQKQQAAREKEEIMSQLFIIHEWNKPKQENAPLPKFSMAGVEINPDDLDRGRQLYGMGRLNLDGAMSYAQKHFSVHPQEIEEDFT